MSARSASGGSDDPADPADRADPPEQDDPSVAIVEHDRALQRWSTLDMVRIASGAAIALAGIVLAEVATDTLGGMQADLARAVGRLPGPARTASIGLAQVAAVVAPVGVLVAALAARMGRMVVSIALAAALAAAGTALIGHTVIDQAQPAAWQVLVERESWIAGRSFPTSAYLAGAVAAVVVSVRWLGPRWSRPLWTVVGAFAVVRVLSGTNLPLDLLVALGVGIAAGAVALVVIGAPDLSPRGAVVVAALRRCGLGPSSLVEVDAPPGVGRSYLARSPGGELVVDVSNESDRDRDLIARLYRRVRNRTATDVAVFTSVERAVERAAFAGLWLDRLGVRVARPVAVARIAPGSALVAHTPEAGTSLTELGADVTDGALAAAWQTAAALHRDRVAHGALDGDAVVVDDDEGIWLRRLHDAVLDAPTALLLIDRANLLVSTALTVGPERAAAACHAGLGREGLAATLPYVQPAALPLATRLRVRGREGPVRAVRDRARDLTGAEEVELVRLARVRPATLLRLTLGLLALVVLLPQMTDLGDAAQAMGDADWRWLVPVFVAMPLFYVGSCWTFRAATPVRTPFGLTYLTQVAAAMLNRVTPNGIGGLGTNMRFLQRSGYATTDAATVMALITLNGGIAGALLIVVFLTWAGQSQAAFPWPGWSQILVVAGAALGVVGLVAAVPAVRRIVGDRLGPVVRHARTSVAELLTDPRRCATMLSGSLMSSLLQLTCLWSVLHAFDAAVGIAVMGAVLFGGKAIAGAAPTPGGVGAVEAVLIGGLSGAGVDPAIATPAVLVFRLLTQWAVIVPGWFALRYLRARHAL